MLTAFSLNVSEFPEDASWSTQLYSRVSDQIRKIVPALDGIEFGRSDKWITIWKVQIVGNEPDLSTASPCSISADFLSRQYEDVWYYVQVRSEVSEEVSFTYVRCRTGQRKVVDGDKKTGENNRLLRSLDSVTAGALIADQRAEKSREDADKWHSECLSKDRRINELEMRVSGLEGELQAALENQAPMVDEAIAEKLGGRLIEVLQMWATTPTDKGYAAKILKSVLGLMVSIQTDDEIKRILLKRHRKPFEGIVESFNEVMGAMQIPDRLCVPALPRSSAKELPRKRKTSEANRGN